MYRFSGLNLILHCCSVAQSRLTLCNPMKCSTLGLSVNLYPVKSIPAGTHACKFDECAESRPHHFRGLSSCFLWTDRCAESKAPYCARFHVTGAALGEWVKRQEKQSRADPPPLFGLGLLRGGGCFSWFFWPKTTFSQGFRYLHLCWGPPWSEDRAEREKETRKRGISPTLWFAGGPLSWSEIGGFSLNLWL